MGVSKNRGTPKSSILIGFSIVNHPFSPVFLYTQKVLSRKVRGSAPFKMRLFASQPLGADFWGPQKRGLGLGVGGVALFLFSRQNFDMFCGFFGGDGYKFKGILAASPKAGPPPEIRA